MWNRTNQYLIKVDDELRPKCDRDLKALQLLSPILDSYR
ncbi:MAG: hypothetical protein ACJA0X_002659 [Cyclobacteriaceae bacterium]|jgi:hypothetical protein